MDKHNVCSVTSEPSQSSSKRVSSFKDSPDIHIYVYVYIYIYLTLRHSNTGLVSSGASLTSWGKGVFVGHPSSDGVTIKIAYRIDVLIDQLRTPYFPIGLVKTESDFNFTSVETGLGR